MHSWSNLFTQLIHHHLLLWQMAKRDFKSSYLGSALGASWLVLEPAFYVSIMWFFFTMALKARPSGEIPFVPWLMSAMALWSYFGAVFSGSSSTFKSYAYLLKKPGFNMALLPTVKITSALVIHSIYLFIVAIVIIASDIPPTLYWFQVIYYWFCISIFLIGISWITGSIGIFIRDIQSATGIILQLGFWVSPIFWDINSYPEKYRWIMKANPLYYPLSGYRDSLIYGIGFWQRPADGLYFWSVTLFTLIFGYWVFNKLRPQFGDVL